MKIKGHSIIELKDVNTGEVERYEDDNIVTNGVAKYIEDLGMFNAHPLVSDDVIKSHPIETMMGGLLLFDNTITEDVNTITCPSGVKMVGNGSYNVTADGADGVTELGSWNSTESGWMSDGSYKMVWDFATTQANGTIACACLTSANHGYIGEGNSTSNSMVALDNRRSDYERTGTVYNFYQTTALREHFNNTLLVHASRTNSTMTFIKRSSIIYNPATASEHVSQTGKLVLQTYKVPLKIFDLRDSFPYNNNGGYEHIPISEVEITVPTDFKNLLGARTPMHTSRHGKNWYAITVAGNQSGWSDYSTLSSQTIQIMKIAPDNTVTGYSAVIPSPYHLIDLHNVGFTDEGQICMPIFKVVDNVGYWSLWFQDMTNQADEDILDTTGIFAGRQNGETYNFTDDGTMGIGTETGYVYKVDLRERTIAPTNHMQTPFLRQGLDDNKMITCSHADGIELIRAQNYLATINNLETSVTKTAEKTMKVTYILRFGE